MIFVIFNFYNIINVACNIIKPNCTRCKKNDTELVFGVITQLKT